MKREVIPLRGPELMYAINRTLVPSLQKDDDAVIELLPLSFLARNVRDDNGFVEITIETAGA